MIKYGFDVFRVQCSADNATVLKLETNGSNSLTCAHPSKYTITQPATRSLVIVLCFSKKNFLSFSPTKRAMVYRVVLS